MPIIILTLGVIVTYWLWADAQPNPMEGSPGEPFPKNPWGDFKPGDRIIILGLPLSGKTYLAGKLTKNVPRILFFDPYHDYAEAGGATEIEAEELIANPSILDKPTFRYAIIPDEDDLAEQLSIVDKIARAAGNLVFVMDEVGDYKRDATVTLEKLARNGRHDGLVPIYVSQVAMDIPRTVRRLASRVYSFRQVDIDDLDALSERYGEKYAAEVSNLKLHEYRVWTMTGFGRSIPSTSKTSQPQSAKSQTPQT